jgi:hypothetical protein
MFSIKLFFKKNVFSEKHVTAKQNEAKFDNHITYQTKKKRKR